MKTKIILGSIIGGLGIACLVMVSNLESMKDKIAREAEDGIIEEIKQFGFIQLEHSITGEPMVITEDIKK